MISPSLVCLNSYGIVRILLSCELARLKFALLVIFYFRLGSKLPFLFPFLLYFLIRFHFSRTLCRFFSYFVSRGRWAVSFIVLFGLIRFVGTWVLELSIDDSPSLVCLNSYGIVRILLSCELARLKFALLVIFYFRLGSKLPFLFPFLLYFLIRFHFSRTLCRFFSYFVSRGRWAVSFIVLFGLIRFVGTWSFLQGPWCWILVFFKFK